MNYRDRIAPDLANLPSEVAVVVQRSRSMGATVEIRNNGRAVVVRLGKVLDRDLRDALRDELVAVGCEVDAKGAAGWPKLPTHRKPVANHSNAANHISNR